MPLLHGQVFLMAGGDLALLQGAALDAISVAGPGPVFLGTPGKTAQAWFAVALQDDTGFPLEGLGEWDRFARRRARHAGGYTPGVFRADEILRRASFDADVGGGIL